MVAGPARRLPPPGRGLFRAAALLVTAWLLLGLNGAGAGLIMAAAYAGCLVHAGIALFSREPAARGSLLLDIAVIYCSILGAVAFCCGAFLINVITADHDRSSNRDGGIKASDWRGLWWVIYGVVAGGVVVALDHHVAPAWLSYLAVAVAVLGVVPIYSACSWSRPASAGRLIFKSKPAVPAQRIVWPWRTGAGTTTRGRQDDRQPGS
jgi:hypothetical protein